MVATSLARVAVVTGANKGVGFCIALQLGLSGLFSDVIIGCRDETRGLQAAQSLNQLGGTTFSKFEYVPLIVGDSTSHTAFVKQMERNFGQVDVLINNAGFAYKSVDQTPFQGQTKKTLEINYFGLADFTEQMIPLLRKGADPRIVNVASMAGRLKQVSNEIQSKLSDEKLTMEELNALMKQFAEDVQKGVHTKKGWSNSNYGMSKLGVIAATKVWARREQSISVNAICPGYCDTDMTSHRGTRSPEEGARNALIPATMKNPPTGELFMNFEIAHW